MSFFSDNEWQRKMRDAILQPYYERRFPGQYEFIEHGDPRDVGGVDTLINGQTSIDEKIVRWPRDKDTGALREFGYTAFALETMSNIGKGFEKDGWMVTNTVKWLLYCNASFDEQWLDCFQIDMLKLKEWFWEQDREQWHLHVEENPEQKNIAHCRIVPHATVLEAVGYRKLFLVRPPHYDDDHNLIHACRVCGEPAGRGYEVSLRKGQLGYWLCSEHATP